MTVCRDGSVAAVLIPIDQSQIRTSRRLTVYLTLPMSSPPPCPFLPSLLPPPRFSVLSVLTEPVRDQCLWYWGIAAAVVLLKALEDILYMRVTVCKWCRTTAYEHGAKHHVLEKRAVPPVLKGQDVEETVHRQ